MRVAIWWACAVPVVLGASLAPAVALAQGTASAPRMAGEAPTPTVQGDRLPAEQRDAEARNLFEAGRLATDDGRYEEALAYFRRSHELSGRPALLFNIGSMAERLQRRAEAIDAYREFLEQSPDASERPVVERRISLLEADLRLQPEPQAAASGGLSEPGPREAQVESTPLRRKWWFWTLLGAAAVGGVVAVSVAAGGSGVQAPLPGRDGIVITTSVLR